MRKLIDRPLRGGKVLRMFGTGITVQALLSAASFAVGLVLIRGSSDLDYSYYVLVTNTILLVTAIQNAFFQGYTVINLTRADETGRKHLVGSLVHAWKRSVPWLAVAAIVITAALWGLGLLTARKALLVEISTLAAAAAARREFFRMMLLAYRNQYPVLRADFCYALLLVAGAVLATWTPLPADVAILGMGLAAVVGGILLNRSLWRHEQWLHDGSSGMLRKVATLGGWAVFGAGIHWALIQGYSYLVAGLIDVRAIAAIAATRLCLMPIFLMSSGVSMFLFPITSRWVHDRGPPAATRRLSLLVASLLAAALVYVAVMWLARDWIFAAVLKRSFPHRDILLQLWSAVFLITLCRDQLATLPASQERFRDLSLFTAASAIIWLGASYEAIRIMGSPGAVLGILIGETSNLCGIGWLIYRQCSTWSPQPPAGTAAGQAGGTAVGPTP